MTRCWFHTVGLLMTVMACVHQGSAAAGGENHSGAGRTLLVTSGRCMDLEQTMARQKAELVAQRRLSDELASLAEELTGTKLSSRQLAEEQAWLLRQPGVNYEKEQTVNQKTYGPVAQQTITLHVPQSVLAEWSERLVRHRKERLKVLITVAGANVAAWLIGWLGLVQFDRITGGYRRQTLLGAALVLLGGGTLLGWMGVLWAV
uniref:Uncharacterized protein n=1 Tax=Schlesneria paludicola TaxID=360056 RepID=A0A7C4QSS8_9PLAN